MCKSSRPPTLERSCAVLMIATTVHMMQRRCEWIWQQWMHMFTIFARISCVVHVFKSAAEANTVLSGGSWLAEPLWTVATSNPIKVGQPCHPKKMISQSPEESTSIMKHSWHDTQNQCTKRGTRAALSTRLKSNYLPPTHWLDLDFLKPLGGLALSAFQQSLENGQIMPDKQKSTNWKLQWSLETVYKERQTLQSFQGPTFIKPSQHHCDIPRNRGRRPSWARSNCGDQSACSRREGISYSHERLL